MLELFSLNGKKQKLLSRATGKKIIKNAEAKTTAKDKIETKEGPNRTSNDKVIKEEAADDHSHQSLEATEIFFHDSKAVLSSPLSNISIIISLPPTSSLLI